MYPPDRSVLPITAICCWEFSRAYPPAQRSVFDLSTGPNRIILYQKNIEAVCRNETEIRHEVRQTVLHELGHYFRMDEAQLKDV
jgi:predicted Zn-dependent protease with MMP-like domain